MDPGFLKGRRSVHINIKDENSMHLQQHIQRFPFFLQSGVTKMGSVDPKDYPLDLPLLLSYCEEGMCSLRHHIIKAQPKVCMLWSRLSVGLYDSDSYGACFLGGLALKKHLGRITDVIKLSNGLTV